MNGKDDVERSMAESLCGDDTCKKRSVQGIEDFESLSVNGKRIAIISAILGCLVTLITVYGICRLSFSSPSPPLTITGGDDSLLPLLSSLSQNSLLTDSVPLNCTVTDCHSLCTSVMLADSVGIRRGGGFLSFCEDTVKDYVNSLQYKLDYDIAVYFIKKVLFSLPIKGDGRDLVVFDIDETLLSNFPYYEVRHYGNAPFNSSEWNQWVLEEKGLPFESIKKVYNGLLEKKWKIALITGRDESQRNATTNNLQKAGFSNWTELYLRSEGELKLPAAQYKSGRRGQLENKGFRIWGNIGDQWSDLEGYSVGNRTFKLPNPFYNVG